MPPIPNATIQKSDAGATAVQPSTTGILAIIAAGSGSVKNQPATFTRPTDIVASTTNGGMGPGCQFGTYYLTNAKKPVVLILPSTSTVGAYGAITHTFAGGSTALPVAGAAVPLLEASVIVRFLNNVVLGTTGGLYQYSLDNGSSFSAAQNLGTALSITLAYPQPSTAGSTGIQFTLGTSAQTLTQGDVFACPTTRPQMTNTDLVAALEALRTYAGNWDNVLIDADATAQMVATVDQWLTGLGSRWKMAWMNTRHKTAGETEAAFATAMATATAAMATDNVDVGTDGGFLPDTLTGLNLFAPTSLAIATRCNPSPVGQDPAWGQLGPVPGFSIVDNNGLPIWHNEDTSQGNPGLDALRLSTFRTFPGSNGVFITNARLCSNPSSPYQYDQHARTMNAFLTAGFPLLQTQLSRSLRKQAPDPITGKIYALEADLESIEEFVNPLARQAVDGQVNDAAFVLNRTDDMSSQSGPTINAQAEVESLAYPKTFNVTASLVRTITIPTSASAGNS